MRCKNFLNYMMLETLTRKEKHNFNQSGFDTIPDWLAYQVSKKVVAPIENRSNKVLRWLQYLIDTDRWVPELKSLEAHISEDDVRTGRESVHKIIRLTKIRIERSNEPLAPKPAWFEGSTKTITLLESEQQIALVGAELEVCLDRDFYREQYIESVKSGNTHIFSIRTRCGLSAFELAWNKALIQHKAYNNGIPNKRHKAILRAFMSRIGGSVAPVLPEFPNVPVPNNVASVYAAHVESEAARIRALAEINRISIDMYNAQVELYRAQIATLNTPDTLQIAEP